MSPLPPSSPSTPPPSFAPMSFCSACGTERSLKFLFCPNCKKDFRYLTEVNAYPFMVSLRRHLFKGLNPAPNGLITITEPNVPLEVFESLFSKFGRILEGGINSAINSVNSGNSAFNSGNSGANNSGLAGSILNGHMGGGMMMSGNIMNNSNNLNNLNNSNNSSNSRKTGSIDFTNSGISPDPSPRKTGSGNVGGTGNGGREFASTVTRVIWKKTELEAICKFQSVEPRKALGAAILFPEALGCACVIPPFFVTHTRTSDAIQTMTVRYSYAFLNSAARIFQPPKHCLDLNIWGAPSILIDPQSYIIDCVAAYPSELKSVGIGIPEQVIKSATAILNSRHRSPNPEQEQQFKSALEIWAAKAKNSKSSSTWDGNSSTSSTSSSVSSNSSPKSVEESPMEVLR